MEDAGQAPDAPEDHRFTTTVSLREALGSEVLVHFEVDVPLVVTEDTLELARDSGLEDLGKVEAAAVDVHRTPESAHRGAEG